jgi:hypothetical protein
MMSASSVRRSGWPAFRTLSSTRQRFPKRFTSNGHSAMMCESDSAGEHAGQEVSDVRASVEGWRSAGGALASGNRHRVDPTAVRGYGRYGRLSIELSPEECHRIAP